jgi:hypothetical protein
MPGLSDSGRNAYLDGFTDAAVFASLHTADPGTAGTAEVSGSPYTREAITWGAASAGTVSSSAEIVFDVPASTITFLGFWSASTAGTFYGSRALDTSQTYATDGTYTIASGNLSESVT